MEHWQFPVDFGDIYLESIYFSLYLFLPVSPAMVESISPPSKAWEGYCCRSCLECLLGEEVASIRAWLLSVPGTPRPHFCATDTHFGSPVQSRCAVQMPRMAHRQGWEPAQHREGDVYWNRQLRTQELLSCRDVGYCSEGDCISHFPLSSYWLL